MATSATFTKDPATGIFSSTGGGMANTSYSTSTPYGSPATGYFANYQDAVDASNKIISAQSAQPSAQQTPPQTQNTPSAPSSSVGSLAPQPVVNQPFTGKIGPTTSTGNDNLDKILGVPPGTPPPPPGSNPYTVFNQQVSQLLTQLQGAQTVGSKNLGDANTNLTAMSVNPNQGQSANPGVFSQDAVAGQKVLQSSFQPAIAWTANQLSNFNSGISNLGNELTGLQNAYKPTEISGGNSMVGPDGKVISTAPAYNSSINFVTNAPYGFSSPTKSGGGSGIATSTGNVDLSTYATDPNYIASMQRQYTSTSTDVQSLLPQFNGDLGSAITQYIKNNGGSSKISGQMIVSAATAAGIDPLMLSAQILHETDFGATGEAPKNNNPGGVKFAGQPGATRGSPAPDGGDFANFKTWSQGIAAEASEIARRQTSSSSSSNGGLVDINADAQALVSGSVSPQVLQARYSALGATGAALYNQVVTKAKQLNPAFNENAATLNYEGQQTQTQNENSGNPVTSIWSNLKNLVTNQGVGSILNPGKSQGSTYNGITLPN